MSAAKEERKSAEAGERRRLPATPPAGGHDGSRRRRHRPAGLVAALVGVLVAPSLVVAAPPAVAAEAGVITTRVSVDSAGGQANGGSESGATSADGRYVSADGRYVAFDSVASNLVPDDTFKLRDVFVHDRTTGATTRVSVSSTGEQAVGTSSDPAISGDGRFVAFTSDAYNLLGKDSSGAWLDLNTVDDVYVHDRDADADGVFDEAGAIAITRVSVSSAGEEAKDGAKSPDISTNGRFVAFQSSSSNLVADDKTQQDVFLRDRDTDGNRVFDEPEAVATTKVSLADASLSLDAARNANGASAAPTLNGDGTLVAFHSTASNLVAQDTNGRSDVFVHDRSGTTTTTRVSVSSGGLVGSAQGDRDSFRPSMSADGRLIAFDSNATNLVQPDLNGVSDVYVHDRDADADGVFDEAGAIAITRVSVSSSSGAAANGTSLRPSISSCVDRLPCRVAFDSDAPDLVGDDTNGATDVFAHDLGSATTTRVSVNSSSAQAQGASLRPTVSRDGSRIAFQSAAPNLVAGDTNEAIDVFVRAPAPKEFAIRSSPTTHSLEPGEAANYALTITPSGGVSGSVDLAVSGLPAGATASFAPNPASSSSTLAVTTATTTEPGTYPLTVSATSGTLTQTTTVTLAVGGPDFALAVSPSSQTVPVGATTSYGVTITASGGFNDSVDLAVSGLPAGATGTFSPDPATDSSTLSVSTAATTRAGTYELTISGTAGSRTRTTTVTLTVSDFALAASPSSQTVTAGDATSYGVTITPRGGFSDSVDLAVSGLPAGATAAFSPDPATDSSALSVTTATTTPAGTYELTITGTAGSLTRTTTVTLSVTVPPGFALSASPSSQTVVQGKATTYDITITRTGGFNGAVSLSVSGLPKGATAGFNPNPATTSSTLSVATTTRAKIGTFTLTITGTSGSLSATTAVKLVVKRR